MCTLDRAAKPKRTGCPSPNPVLAAVILCAGSAIANPAAASGLFCPVTPPPLALPTDTGNATTLKADKVALQNNVATATGNVRIEQKGQALEAPQLSYDRETTHVRAPDGLEYYRPGLYVTADSGNMNLDTDTGEFAGASYRLTQNGGRGHAQQVKAEGDNQYRLKDASYTTCAGTTKAWLLTASHLELDRTSGRGEAFNTVLHFYGIPVFYSPYLNFPIDDRRHTGLLTPTIGYSNDSGFELGVPYYFNLAPNYDATVIPKFLAKRGLQLSGQFRYLSLHSKGEVDGSWLPNDREYGASRGIIHYRNLTKLARHLGLEARFNDVSDKDYFDDLDFDLAPVSHSQLERSLRLNYARTGVDFSILAQGFQSIDAAQPYTLLPQVQLQLQTPTAPFFAGMDSQFTIFKSDDGIDAQRTDLRPHVDWNVDRGSWFADSEAALRYTLYHFTEDDPGTGAPRDDITRQIPSFSLGGGLRFIRTLDNGWLQTLEPQAFYLYKGYENQSDIPLFDSGVPDLHFDRLFSRQRFVGADRIVDANQVTLGVSSRLVEPGSGRTVLKLDLGRIFSFDDPRVHWPNGIETGYSDNGNSDYVAAAEYRPNDHISTGIVAQYDPDDQTLDRAVARVGYRNDSGFRLNLAWHRYRNFRFVHGELDTLEQTSIGMAVPLGHRLNFVGRWNYSLQDNRTVEALAGLEYRPSCCWAARLAWRRAVDNDDGSYDNAIMFQLVLRGLSAFGDASGSNVSGNIFNATASGFDTMFVP